MTGYKGLKVGLEVHIQLDTGRKLFCKCPSNPVVGRDIDFIRRLRPTQSELGQVDPAALFEFEKGLTIRYSSPVESSCLVEMDEEPPHLPDELAIDVAVAIADYLGMDVVDELIFMRKIVVDGSNTTGFQRTGMVGINGYFYIGDKRYGVQSLAIEEEASRLLGREGSTAHYSLDRLGIPLIEISTAPDISSPDEAVRVARYLGRLVRSTGYKRGGIGSVRQDVNISVDGGAVVEIKGVQQLDQLEAVIRYEYNRQRKLIEIARILADRGVSKEEIASQEEVLLTDIFRSTSSKIVRRVLDRGGEVFGIRLPKFAGILGMDIGGRTFAREILDRLRFWTGLKGLFHSDELPGYGISSEEVEAVRRRLGMDEMDGFIIVGLEDPSLRELTFEKIRERCAEALDGVPPETRAAGPDGSTYYMRPRPGMARMYPETDVPPIPVGPSRIKDIRERIVVRDPEEVINELVERYGISREEAEDLYDSDLLDLFESILSSSKNLKPRYVIHLIRSIPRSLSREGVDMERVTPEVMLRVAQAVDRGVLAKEAVEEVYREVAKGMDVDDAIERHKMSMDTEELRSFLMGVLETRSDLRELPREILVKRLMGIAMSKYRGKVDPKTVLRLVEEIV